MPRIRIETTLQLERAESLELMKTVVDAVVATLNLVPDDRTVSFTAFEPGLFIMKPPYTIYIEIALFSGRSKAVKKELYQAIVRNAQEKHGIGKECIMIMLNEQPRENWGLRGGVPANELDFNYRIEV